MSSNTLIEVFGHVVFSFTRTHCFETFPFSLDWALKAEKMDIKCTEFAENAEYTKIYSAGVCLVSTFNTDVLSLSKYIST